MIPKRNLASIKKWTTYDDARGYIASVLEELFELVGASQHRYTSPLVQDLTQTILNEQSTSFDQNAVIDALSDIAQHSLINIHFLGYNPEITNLETVKEIESRRGSIINGKFIKDPKYSKEWYKADYEKARYDNLNQQQSDKKGDI